MADRARLIDVARPGLQLLQELSCRVQVLARGMRVTFQYLFQPVLISDVDQITHLQLLRPFQSGLRAVDRRWLQPLHRVRAELWKLNHQMRLLCSLINSISTLFFVMKACRNYYESRTTDPINQAMRFVDSPRICCLILKSQLFWDSNAGIRITKAACNQRIYSRNFLAISTFGPVLDVLRGARSLLDSS